MHVIKSKRFIALICLVLGALIVLGIRFVSYKPPEAVHYHANFALYINGQRELFKGPQNYEESQICSAKDVTTPMARVHLHDQVSDVVHVHDEAVTWGNFFQNVGWSIGASYLVAPNGTLYPSNGASKLRVILNGEELGGLTSIADRVIKDEDRLLVSYGNESQEMVQKQFVAVPRTAHHYDVTPDPESCSGHEKSMLRERLSHLF